MTAFDQALSGQERVSALLRALYRSWGFRTYKVNRFEEYDLYMRFKSFLTDARVLTFTDTDGKLMALKPDITLSVVKNAREKEYPLRICYTESVYRVPRGAIGFREITQTGIESIGALEDWDFCEALLLAAKSLDLINPGRWRLDVSDQGILSDVLLGEHLTEEEKASLLMNVSEKNVHDLARKCAALHVRGSTRDRLCALVGVKGPLAGAAAEAAEMDLPPVCREKLRILQEMGLAGEALGLRNMALDFSVVSDMRYYNGLVFSGFVEGAASSVLSGGRYDPIMASLGKAGSAVGFAVYLDQIDRLFPSAAEAVLCEKPEGKSLAEKALKKAASAGEVG